MRILFIAPQPFFLERGTPIAVRLTVELLCRAGHEVDLLTLHEGADVQIQGMRLHRIAAPPGISNVPIGFSLKKIICDLWLLQAALRLTRRKQFDTVHAVEEAVFIGLLCRSLRRVSRVVYDMDSLMADQIGEKWKLARALVPILRWVEGQAIRRSDLVLAVCKHIVERARQHKQSELVHWTPDVAFTDSAAAHEFESLRSICRTQGPLALYVGNLEFYQGVDLLLAAVQAVPPERRCNLVVIGGEPADILRYREVVANRQLSLHVTFLGKRPLGALPHFLQEADILCSPRLHGVNTPMKIYSYLASGKAILATDIASHRQILDETCSLLVEPEPAAVGRGLDLLASDRSLRDSLGAKAAERAGLTFSLAAFDRRLCDAYQAIAPVE